MNTDYCQLHNTIIAYAPHLEGVIKAVRGHIELKELEIEKHRESDRIYVSECQKRIAADKEFLQFCDIAQKYVTLEKLLVSVRIAALHNSKASIAILARQKLPSDREKLIRLLGWQIERGWDLPNPQYIPGWDLNRNAIILTEDIEYTLDRRVRRMGTAYWYRNYLFGDPMQDLLDYGYVDFHLIPQGEE
jgi:hypothetical protein